MKKNAVETILGAVVLVTAITFLVFALNTAQVRAVVGYDVTAAFFKVGGLTSGSDVRINGIKVGTVNDLNLDAGTFDAVVSMSIREGVKIPTDSVAAIGSSGIVGGKFVSIQPGGSKEYLAEGGKITRTKDFKSLEDQVGEIIFLATGGGS
ncbi:MAG: outer membrane lipid asymmetry maintenance protein MlaD [Rhodospirillales bacterium]|nr:outer membrane lipid asymmetry maintenance protein MlaD [Rhodospirillales bacterium]MBO6786565.1 outer membrane lipid asymmetry maintenance protein MlaD [Rhodospirillales bacterium]